MQTDAYSKGTDAYSKGLGQYRYNVTPSRSAETVGGDMADCLLDYAETTNQSATELVGSVSEVHMGEMRTGTKPTTLRVMKVFREIYREFPKQYGGRKQTKKEVMEFLKEGFLKKDKAKKAEKGFNEG